MAEFAHSLLDGSAPMVGKQAIILSVLALLLTRTAYSQVGKQSDLLPVSDGEKWGFVDKSGKIAIPLQYRSVGPFSEGLAVAFSGHEYGYINEQGQWAIRLKGFHSAEKFSEGLAAIAKSSRNGLEWTYIDNQGATMIGPSQFYTAEPFSDGLALVSVFAKSEKSHGTDLQYGYINREGKFVIPPKFSEAKSFSDGLALVYVEKGRSGEAGYIDKTGEYVIRVHNYALAQSFSEGLAVVLQGSEYGYIDRTGRVVIDYRYDEAEEFHNGLAKVRIFGRYGFINKEGEFVIGPLYWEASNFSDGFAAVYESSENSGIIDAHGDLIAPFPLRWAEAAGDGLFFVQHSVFGGGAYVDKNGRLIYRWPSGNSRCPLCLHFRDDDVQKRESIRFESDPSKANVYLVPIRWLEKRPDLLSHDQELLGFLCPEGPTTVQCYALPGTYWAVFALNAQKCRLHIDVVKNELHKYFFSFKNPPAAACQ
jgi:hypothetical protein